MSSDAAQITLLLVEDDPSLQEGVRDLLEIADFEYDVEVMMADDGLAALEIMRQKAPDLIISDIMMPRMGGFEFLKEVRRNEDWVHVPFIFVTAKGKKQDILDGRLSGAEMYITKPFDSNELIDLIKIQIDRSLQKRHVQQKQMDTLKRSILQVLNHEFRTPLTYVTAYYEMLASSVSVYKDTENMGDYLHGIRGGCERMSDLVEDLIQVMDIRSGETYRRFQENAAPIDDLVALIEQVVQQMKPLAAQKDVALETDLPAELPTLSGLRNELTIALRHLIENGIKFTHYKVKEGHEGKVLIGAKTEQNGIVLTVIDQGIGIPAAVQPQIFELFMQHNRDLYEQQGSGAGLAIVKGIVDAHHGRIEIDSEVDRGATVSLHLPLQSGERTEVEDTPASTFNEVREHEPQVAHILLVEDDPSVLASLVDLVNLYDGRYSLTVACAADGRIGLEKIAEQKPDLIISDIMMPNMDGYEFVRQIRQNPEWVQIPVVFLSARTERDEIIRGRRVGAEEYVTKPYDTDEMLSLMTAMLNRHFQLQNIVDEDFEKFKLSILQMLRPDFLGSLASVNDYSALLSNGVSDVNTSKDLRDALRGIQIGSQRVSTLVEDFIALAEIKTGETETAFRSRAQVCTDLSLVLEEIVQRYTVRDGAGKIPVYLIPGLQNKAVIIDVDGFEKAIKRLLDMVDLNAHKGGGQTIYIETTQVGDDICLQIWQDGRALPADAVTAIGDLLESEDGAAGNEVEYGPRLLIMQRLIEIHGGTVRFEAGQQGDGSLSADTFLITLPTVDELPDMMTHYGRNGIFSL